MARRRSTPESEPLIDSVARGHLLDHIRSGLSRKAALRLCCLPPDSPRRWRVLARTGDIQAAGLIADMAEAEALRELDLLAILKELGEGKHMGSARAIIYLLEQSEMD